MYIKPTDIVCYGMRKQAMAGKAIGMAGSAASGVGSWLSKQVGKQNFLGGLMAPVSKLYGGVKKVVGLGQQGAAGLTNNSGLYAQGAKNVAQGAAQRADAAFMPAIKKGPLPWGYRAGRILGGATIGAPLFMAPFKGSEYMGAASADPSLVEGHAKAMAQDRISQRGTEFAAMPFMQRMQAAWNPEQFSNKILNSSPEALDVHSTLQQGPTNNPGVMKYLASFNPFLGLDPIKQKVRHSVFTGMGINKQGMDKSGQQLFSKFIAPAAKAGWKAFRSAAPRTPAFNKSVGRRAVNKILMPAPGAAPATVGQGMLTRGVYHAAANPVKTGLGVAGVASTPYFMNSSYNDGKRQVYATAADTATGLADLQFANQFSQPGMMNTGMRMGGAMFPGIMQDYINRQARNTLYQGGTQEVQAPQQMPAAPQAPSWWNQIFGAEAVDRWQRSHPKPYGMK